LEPGAPVDNRDIALRIVRRDAEACRQLAPERRLDGDEAEACGRVAPDDEVDPARAQDADAVEQDQPVRQIFGRQRIPVAARHVQRSSLQGQAGSSPAMTNRHYCGSILARRTSSPNILTWPATKALDSAAALPPRRM